ncbi:hypothetical protein Vadar_003132 [Vaccinium darrowii]|uniref:Uncharacterized protein n=1 Tax=Vaccinium darrowii TaxID=229202 RepID=A0ACB7YUJ4_9ERIC|nr:hypothetical protein Vadar_003132 [Vaccinium darrowii]
MWAILLLCFVVYLSASWAVLASAVQNDDSLYSNIGISSAGGSRNMRFLLFPFMFLSYPSTQSRGANTLKLVEIRKGRGLLFSK